MRAFFDVQVRSLIHLPRLMLQDGVSMHKFSHQVVRHVRSVESMGDKFKSETLTPVLVPLIVDKLPKRVVEKWELEIGDHKEDCVAVKTLFTFLVQLIRAKESSQPPSLESKLPTKENTTKGESRVNLKPSSP